MVFTLSDDSDDVIVLRLPVARSGLRSILTASELEVAELACAGLSNATIAARRGCASRTIANQLASIFRRLSVDSRHELAALLAEEDLGG
jgi:DNA-binding CsgD family transcriptional regulator